MRKILSSNSEASINLESLMEDEDLNKTFKRADLEELIDPVISDFYMTLKESVEKFGKYNKKLQCVNKEHQRVVGTTVQLVFYLVMHAI